MKKISIIILIITIPLVSFFIYMGGSSEVKISKAGFSATEVIFDTHLGSYQGLKKSWERFVGKYKKAGLKKCLGIGIYLDPPGTPEDKLRSIMGCDITQLPLDLKNKLKQELMFAIIPQSQGFKSQFPYKNELSFMFAAIMVYPKYQVLIESGELSPSVAIESYGYDEDRTEIKFFMPHAEPQGSYDAFYKAF